MSIDNPTTKLDRALGAEERANERVCRLEDLLKLRLRIAAKERADLEAENEALRSNHARLVALVDSGSIHDRIYSAGLEQEKELDAIKANRDEYQVAADKLAMENLELRSQVVALRQAYGLLCGSSK